MAPLALVCALAGCSSSDAAGSAPSPLATAPDTATAEATASLSPEQVAVRDAYLAYWAVFENMSAGAPVEVSRLRTVAVPALAQRIAENVATSQDVGKVTRGALKHAVSAVGVTGASGSVTDCVDQSGWVTIAKTASVTPSTNKQPKQKVVATMKKTPEGWRMSAMTQGASC